jgi:hypothetical protein
MTQPITFRASLPPIQSAIKVGEGAMRVQLDIPASDTPQAIALAALHGIVLRVTIEIEDDDQPTYGSATLSRSSAKRRKPQSDSGV